MRLSAESRYDLVARVSRAVAFPSAPVPKGRTKIAQPFMIPIPDLNLGFRDAENYKRRENKDLFNRIFIRTRELDNLCALNVFFLVGEKGTGKTAYAVYLANNSYKNTRSPHCDLFEKPITRNLLN